MATLTEAPGAVASGLPVERGGWWHHYVCPVHGVELIHGDLLIDTYPSGGVACRHGCVVDSPAVRGAWYVLAHQAWARRIRLLARGGQREAAITLLIGYRDTYRKLTGLGEHEQAQSWMLRGKLFQQALTEAIWAVSIADAALVLAAEDTADLVPVLPLLDALTDAAATARAALVAEDRFSSNYTTWLNAAGAGTSRAAALIRGGKWDDSWLRGEHGLFAQLLASTTADGWEWEASTYYHGFVLRAALLTLRGADPAALPAEVRGRLRAMIDVLGAIASPGGILPALHDGPYLRTALCLEWLELVALAEQFSEHTGLAEVAALSRTQAGDADDGLDRMLGGWFGGPPLAAQPTPPHTVAIHPEAGYAVLRAPGMLAIADYGPHGGSHGHLDKLALYLYGRDTAWQPDPGQVPYGHKPLRAHYASTAAHPAFSVDGLPQRESAGSLVRATENEVLLAADDCYPGVRARRLLLVHGDYLIDALCLTAQRARALTVHLRPDCALELRLHGAALRSSWSGAQTLHGAHLCTETAFPVVHEGYGPADDPQRARAHVDWTAIAERAVFCSVYRVAAAIPENSIRLRGDALLDIDGARIRLNFEDHHAE